MMCLFQVTERAHLRRYLRAALGAGRGRIFLQFITERVMLSIFGGALGMLLGWWSVRMLVAMAPPLFPRVSEISLESGVLLFSAGVSLVTGIVFGLAPALHASKSTLAESWKDATRGGSSEPPAMGSAPHW